jgi:hypothetical protein
VSACRLSTQKVFRFVGIVSLLIATLFNLHSIGWAQLENAAANGEVVRINKIEDVIRLWKPGRHLFIKGDLPIGPEQSRQLQNWLSTNGRHWTIVLMDTAQGEFYRANDGRDYYGMDAVEYALGHGLSNQTAFGELVHPKTKETDGAIFAMFLQERKFSYFGSTAQDNRRLGESNWIGQLDQPAFRAMRGGGRIIDAVKDTVASINEQLEDAIDAEQAAAQQAEQEKRRAIAVVQSGIKTIEQSIAKVEKASTEFRDSFPKATGPLSKPPLEAWKQTVNRINELLTVENIPVADQQRANLTTEVDSYLNAFAANTDFKDHMERLVSRRAKLLTAPNNVAAQNAKQIDELLTKGEEELQSGQLAFVDTMRSADHEADQGEEIVLAENRRLEAERVRKLWIWRTILAMLGLFLAVTAGVLVYFNRRRAAIMQKAIEEYKKRQESVILETENIDKLFEKNRSLLGSKERVDQRGYEGRTKDVSYQALAYVDDLFIMAKEVRRVLAEARARIEPSSISDKLTNYFSSANYQEAIDHISGAPLKFSRETGLPRILQDIARGKKKNAAGSGDETAAAMEVTFEEVYEALGKRSQEAERNLQIIETSLTGIDDALKEVQQGIAQVTQQETALHQDAEKDGLFGIPAFLDQLIPSLQADVAEADRLSAFDAVQAMEKPIPIARRKLNESRKILELLGDARKNLLVNLQEIGAKLQAANYSSQWIGAGLEELSNRANELVNLATERSVGEEITQFHEQLNQLGVQAETALQLAERIEKELRPKLANLHGENDSVRKSLAQKLSLPESQLLNEKNSDPDDYAQRAMKSSDVARAMLNEGKTAATLSAIQTSENEMEGAHAILKASTEAVDSFQERRRNCEEDRQQMMFQVGTLQTQTVDLQRRYTPSAFRLGLTGSTNATVVDESRSEESEEASASKEVASADGATVPEVLRRVQELGNQVATEIQNASNEIRNGRILRGSEILNRSAMAVKYGKQQLDLVANHVEKIDALDIENRAQYDQSVLKLQDVFRSKDDPLVTKETLNEMERVAIRVQRLRSQLTPDGGGLRNPFAISEELANLHKGIEQVEAMVQADHNCHAEATRAVNGAVKQMEVAKGLVRETQTDQIPDSARTGQINRMIMTMNSNVVQLVNELQVNHGDWKSLDERASRLQTEIYSASRELKAELEVAQRALEIFQQASRTVFRAQQWSGPYGLRVTGSPGVGELERARGSLQAGNYAAVLEISRVAAAAASNALELMEREVRRRELETQLARERKRRREMESWTSSGGGFFGGGGGGFGGGFGGGGSFGGGGGHGGGGGSFGGGGSSSGGSSGFSRSGW